MKSFKLLSVILSLVLFVCVMGGCTGNVKNADKTESNADGSTTTTETGKNAIVTFLKWGGGPERDMDLANIENFNKANNNIEVQGEIVTYENYNSKINTLIAADSTPDVFFIQEFLPIEWGEKGIGANLNPFYEKVGIDPNEKYLETALFESNSKLWAVSPNLATILLYYNKELFKNAGLQLPSSNAHDSWTWDEMVRAAKKITTDDNGKNPGEEGFDSKSIKTYGLIVPHLWLFNMPLLYSNGALYASPDGMGLGLDKPEALEVLQGIADLINKEHVAPSIAITGSLPSAPKMLMDGQLGMMVSGTWEDANFASEGFDVGVAPMPVFKKPSNIAWSACFMLSATAENSDAAFKYFMYVTDPDENENVLKVNLPNKKAYYSDKKFAKWSTMNEHTADFIKVIPSVMEVAVCPENVSLKNFGEIVNQTIQPELDKLWLGDSSAADLVPVLKEKTAGKYQGSYK